MSTQPDQTVNMADYERLKEEMAELKRTYEMKKLQFGENIKIAKRQFSESQICGKKWQTRAIAIESKLKVALKTIQ